MGGEMKDERPGDSASRIDALPGGHPGQPGDEGSAPPSRPEERDATFFASARDIAATKAGEMGDLL